MEILSGSISQMSAVSSLCRHMKYSMLTRDTPGPSTGRSVYLSSQGLANIQRVLIANVCRDTTMLSHMLFGHDKDTISLVSDTGPSPDEMALFNDSGPEKFRIHWLSIIGYEDRCCIAALNRALFNSDVAYLFYPDPPNYEVLTWL